MERSREETVDGTPQASVANNTRLGHPVSHSPTRNVRNTLKSYGAPQVWPEQSEICRHFDVDFFVLLQLWWTAVEDVLWYSCLSFSLCESFVALFFLKNVPAISDIGRPLVDMEGVGTFMSSVASL